MPSLLIGLGAKLPMDISQESLSAIAFARPEIEADRKPASGLRVRLFDEGDIPAVRDIMIQHHATTVFRNQPFSDWKLKKHFQTILSRPPRMVCIVAESGGVPSGVAWATADSYMLSDGPLFANVQVIAVDLKLGPIRRAKIFLALVAGLRDWARSMGASHSFVHVTTGSKLRATDRLMQAAGARPVGGAYVVP
ncbi:N-acetyltransferase family protein [Neorhizobium tomejilense]|uniref:GNAT family N-acetyltransferase n=1 Tax=Neorhizobium tomejilense TaxID=2093828 RepID=UPI003ECFCC9D